MKKNASDGFRAISILLVLLIHSRRLNGFPSQYTALIKHLKLFIKSIVQNKLTIQPFPIVTKNIYEKNICHQFYLEVPPKHPFIKVFYPPTTVILQENRADNFIFLNFCQKWCRSQTKSYCSRQKNDCSRDKICCSRPKSHRSLARTHRSRGRTHWSRDRICRSCPRKHRSRASKHQW